MYRRIPLLNLKDQDIIDKINRKEILIGLDIKSDFKSANYNQFLDSKDQYTFEAYYNITKDAFKKQKDTVALEIIKGTAYDRYNYVHRRSGDVIYLPMYALVALIPEETYIPNQVSVGDFFFI